MLVVKLHPPPALVRGIKDVETHTSYAQAHMYPILDVCLYKHSEKCDHTLVVSGRMSWSQEIMDNIFFLSVWINTDNKVHHPQHGRFLVVVLVEQWSMCASLRRKAPMSATMSTTVSATMSATMLATMSWSCGGCVGRAMEHARRRKASTASGSAATGHCGKPAFHSLLQTSKPGRSLFVLGVFFLS